MIFKIQNGIFGCASDKGKKRKLNEDSCFVLENKNAILMIVCDGLGGHQKGEVASKLCVDTIVESFKNQKFDLGGVDIRFWMEKVSAKANENVYKKSFIDEHYLGMGTTLCMVVLFHNRIHLLNVGDSRCYKIFKDKIEQISEDETYNAYLRKLGMKEELIDHNSDNILLNALGTNELLKFKYSKFDFDCEGVLLCSDGLYHEVDDNSLKDLLLNKMAFSQKIQSLINKANNNGGNDNITVCLFEKGIHD